MGPGRDGHDRSRDRALAGAADDGGRGPAQLARRGPGAVREAGRDRPRRGPGPPARARLPGARAGVGPAPRARRRPGRARVAQPQLALRRSRAARCEPPDRARGSSHRARRPGGRPMSEQLVPVLLLLLLFLAALAAMVWGWRRRGRSQQHLPAPADRPLDQLGEGTAHGPVEAVYVDTVLAEQPLERVVAHGLGQRARAQVSLGDGGSWRIEREGTGDLTIPAGSLAEI